MEQTHIQNKPCRDGDEYKHTYMQDKHRYQQIYMQDKHRYKQTYMQEQTHIQTNKKANRDVESHTHTETKEVWTDTLKNKHILNLNNCQG